MRFPLQISDTDAPTTEDSQISREWEAMLSAFRTLGGIAENVRPGATPSDRGLFACDPAQPILVRTPENLLFAVNDIEFAGDHIAIRNEAGAGPAEREFFEKYEALFSRIAGGRTDATSYIDALDDLPADVRAILSADFGMSPFIEGDRIERIRKRFLEMRLVAWNGESAIMPLLELAKPAPDGIACTPGFGGGLQIEGRTEGEILVFYSPGDTFGLFHRFGVVGAQPLAFSLPMKSKPGGIELTIKWNPAIQSWRGGFPTPLLTSTGGELSLSYLMVGNSKSPRLPRGIFRALMREAGAPDADEIFDFILHVNRRRFLKLLEVMEPYRGGMIVTLRKMARHQLDAMTHCIGAREL